MQINFKDFFREEKNKTVKPEPNPDTGEVPLRTGVAQALLDKTTPMPKDRKDNKKLFKKSLGKTKIEVNPNVDIGVASGGKNYRFWQQSWIGCTMKQYIKFYKEAKGEYLVSTVIWMVYFVILFWLPKWQQVKIG